MVAIFEWLLVLALVVIPFTFHSGLLADTKGDAVEQTSDLYQSANNLALEVPVLSALQNPNPQGFRGGAEVQVVDGALVSSGPVGADVIAATKTSSGEISVYTVRANDTISHIADMYGVTVNTIMWANDLTKATAIREGQALIILPIPGVRHVVKSGDTLASIAKKYKGDVDEILAYNQLDDVSAVEVGMALMVPGGLITPPPNALPTRVAGAVSSGGSWLSHPVPGAIKTQGIHGYNAVDLAAAAGTTIRAAAAGEVMVSRNSGWNGGYGQYIVIRHSNGAQTMYAHLSRNDVGVGAYVNQGQLIGAMGNTGRSTGSHLHFEVRGASNPF